MASNSGANARRLGALAPRRSEDRRAARRASVGVTRRPGLHRRRPVDAEQVPTVLGRRATEAACTVRARCRCPTVPGDRRRHRPAGGRHRRRRRRAVVVRDRVSHAAARRVAGAGPARPAGARRRARATPIRRSVVRRQLRGPDRSRHAARCRRCTCPVWQDFPLRERARGPHRAAGRCSDTAAQALALGRALGRAARVDVDDFARRCVDVRRRRGRRDRATGGCSHGRRATPARSATSSSSPTGRRAACGRSAASRRTRRRRAHRARDEPSAAASTGTIIERTGIMIGRAVRLGRWRSSTCRPCSSPDRAVDLRRAAARSGRQRELELRSRLRTSRAGSPLRAPRRPRT